MILIAINTNLEGEPACSLKLAKEGEKLMFIKVAVRVLLGMMIVLNVVMVRFHNPLLLGSSLALGGIIICLDLYQEFTRKKLITYMAGLSS